MVGQVNQIDRIITNGVICGWRTNAACFASPPRLLPIQKQAVRAPQPPITAAAATKPVAIHD